MTAGRWNRTPRRYRWRTLREDYLDFVDGNVVAALLLDFFAKIEDVHSEIAEQGEVASEWREISGKYGGLIVMLRPQPSRETIRAALAVLVERGFIEEHPDNGRPAAVGAPAQKSRYRLHAKVLITRELNWRPSGRGVPSEDADPLSVQTLTLSTETLTLSTETLTPLSVQTSHESVSLESVKEEEGTPLTPPHPELRRTRSEVSSEREFAPTPDYLTSYQRELAAKNDTAAAMNGWQLVAAYAEAIGMRADTVWGVYRNKKAAAALASEHVTPEEVTAIVQEKLASGHPSYRFDFLISDIGFYRASKRKPAADPAAQFIDVATEVDGDGLLLTYGIRADGSRELVGRG